MKLHYVLDNYKEIVLKYLFGNLNKIYKKKALFTRIISCRNITIESDENIKNYVNNFIEKGFINYFGLQRFGSRTLATQTVGK